MCHDDVIDLLVVFTSRFHYPIEVTRLSSGVTEIRVASNCDRTLRRFAAKLPQVLANAPSWTASRAADSVIVRLGVRGGDRAVGHKDKRKSLFSKLIRLTRQTS